MLPTYPLPPRHPHSPLEVRATANGRSEAPVAFQAQAAHRLKPIHIRNQARHGSAADRTICICTKSKRGGGGCLPQGRHTRRHPEHHVATRR